MKRFAVLALATMLLAGCQGRTNYGECIGTMDEANPKLEYKLSVRNVVLACLFFQSIFVPAIVLLTEYKCPVANKP